MSRKAWRGIWKNLLWSLILSFIFGLIGILMEIIFGVRLWALRLSIMGLHWGVVASLTECFTTDLKICSEPNQGIKASIKNTWFLIIFFLILCGIFEIMLISYLREFMDLIGLQIFQGSVASMVVFITTLYGGGLAFIQHVSLRITLYLSHQKPNDPQTRCIPWNYARFLSCAADRKLLQQTGGAYRFIHRSLLEHFAEMGN